MDQNIYYVYQYRDPRTGIPFYVGKGKENRHLYHLSETFQNTENEMKWAYIQGLRNKGLSPIIEIIFTNLDEDWAYDLEETVIKLYGRKNIDENGWLTNRCPDNRPPKTTGNDHWARKNPEKFQREFIEKSHTADVYKKRGKTYSENAKIFGYVSGEKNPRFGDHRNYEELHGVQKANDLKRMFGEKRKGSGNPNAQRWLFISPDGIQISCFGNRKKLSEQLGLDPAGIGRVARSEKGTYKGWSCQKIT